MESYRVTTGIPNTGALQRGYTHPSRPSSRSHNGAGSYGLSIRVQGIDGHPYVVLNNQDRGPPPPQPHLDPNSNGYIDAEGSFIDNYHEYDFRGGGGGAKGSRSTSPFTEYRSQSKTTTARHGAGSPHNGVAADSNGRRSSSALLNFQRHPEILQPYDPERNSLAMDGYHSLPSRPLPLPAAADIHDDDDGDLQRVSSSPPASTEVSHRSPDQSGVPAPQQTKTTPPLPKSQPETAAQPPQSSSSQAQPSPPEAEARVQHAPPQSKPQHAQVAQPQTKPHHSGPPQSKPAPPPQPQQQPITPPPQPRQRSAPAEPPSASSPTASGPPSRPPCSGPPCGSLSTAASSSAGSSLERTRHGEPDVLPLRRTDSSGPVLQTSWSSRSRHSSSSSSTNRTPQDADASLETLYAETINRHENRRYIPFHAGTGRDIDTGSTPGVDELIDRFDGGGGKDHQRRGRTGGRRSRINAEDRKRSRSVDSALPFGLEEGGAYMDEFSRRQGTCMEHVLRPSQLRMQKTVGSQDSWASTVEGKPGATTTTTTTRAPAGAASSSSRSAPGSPQSTISTGVGSIQGYKKPLSRSSTLPPASAKSQDPGLVVTDTASPSLATSSSSAGTKPGTEVDAQVTPDLLKGQQELSQQTHEETAKLILFNYLKDGSGDNDDSTKRKVNLVFEKIQTLKSRATTTTTGSLQGDNHCPDMVVQTKALQEQKAELEETVAQMRKQLEEHATNQKGLRETQGKMTTEVKDLEQQLKRSEEDCSRLRDKLSKTEAELQTTLEELFQVKMEREQYQTEIRDLQDQLSEMHDELDAAKKSAGDGSEKEAIMEELVQMKVDLQEVLMAKEDQEEVLRRRERELTALKGALKEEVATHDQEVDRLREQYETEMGRLRTALEEAKQSSEAVVREKAEVEAARGAAEGHTGRLAQEAERLRRRTQELDNEVVKLNRIVDEAKLQESRLGDKVGRLERDKRQLEESLEEIREQEEEMSRANRALTTRLEDVQRNMAKMNGEHKELEERLKEERVQKEQFKNTKNEIEDERRLLDRTVDKLQREMNDIVEASQSSTQELQEQIDIYKEKNRRELADLHHQLKDRGAEMDTLHLTATALQDQLSRRDEELRLCRQERDEAALAQKTLTLQLYDLEKEAESSSQSKDDKTRHIKLLEDRIVQLELDLDEERNSGDMLMDRIDRGREQVEQMRNELLQERAGRQDLECDKLALERQNKDLKGRVSHLEGSQRSNKDGVVSQMESRIQELEERLEAEERERANLQLANRRLERKVKEMMMQGDEEHHSMQDQKDQLNLRLKALKRQMDEAEEEIDRLEHGKKKLQRDLDEQQEANEQLQSQLKTLRSEMRRKTNSAPLLNNLDDDDDEDDISTDGETYFSSSSGYKRSSSQENMLTTFTL